MSHRQWCTKGPSAVRHIDAAARFLAATERVAPRTLRFTAHDAPRDDDAADALWRSVVALFPSATVGIDGTVWVTVNAASGTSAVQRVASTLRAAGIMGRVTSVA